MSDLEDVFEYVIETMDCSFEWMVPIDIEPGKYCLKIVPTGDSRLPPQPPSSSVECRSPPLSAHACLGGVANSGRGIDAGRFPLQVTSPTTKRDHGESLGQRIRVGGRGRAGQ